MRTNHKNNPIHTTRIATAFLLSMIVLCGTIYEWNPIISAVEAADNKSSKQKTFSKAEDAVEALLTAMQQDDKGPLLDIFGHEYEDILIGGDELASRENRRIVAAAAAEMHMLRDEDKNTKTLIVGSNAWPLPFPLIKERRKWRFDTEAGIEEVINRRIGRNELNAIKVCQAYIGAQVEYANRDRDGDEVKEFAQRIESTEGKHDGLFWKAGEGEQTSPFGPLVADAGAYLKGKEPGDPFMGYYFKIITRQGSNVPGGRYDYIINGNMIAGFAMLAYPAIHGNSGIMTFLCNHQDKLYDKDLGPDSTLIAARIDEYNPDNSWAEVGE